MNRIEIQTLQSRMEELGLSFMAAGLETFLAEKERTTQTVLQSLQDLIELEYIPRKERMARTRLKVSGLPQHKKLDDFDLSWPKGGLTEKKFKELGTLSFIRRKENIILLGPSGLGKTHLMLALAHKACLDGFTAYYISCMDLMERLVKARSMNKLKRKLQWFKKPHLLVIDEVGYEKLEAEEATLFFQLINSRYENGPVIITTNKSFSQWGEMMSDNAIATATLDRLLHHAHIISLKGDSFRMKDRLKIGVVDFE
jgi:DNA replication protein DnaC